VIVLRIFVDLPVHLMPDMGHGIGEPDPNMETGREGG